jgi:hypothetical protein
MSVSRPGSKKKPKGQKDGIAAARRSAVTDAVPDIQSAGRIKKIPEEDEPVAENDEEDD